MTAYRSIAKNYAASAFGMGISFLNQIVMVPIFITFWGVDKYADWILITAFSSFFMMSDLGLNRATNNEFVIQYHHGNYDVCKKLQTNAFFLVLIIFSIFIISSVFVCFLEGFKKLLGVTVFSENQTSIVFILLLSNIFLLMYGRVYHGILRAVSKTHIAILVDNISRFLTLIILLAGIWLHLNIIYILIVYTVPGIGSILFKHFYTKRIFPVKLAFRNFDKEIFKSIIKPSLAFMIFPLGEAISNQGMIFVVSSILGSTILVAFTTTRTVVNFLRQMMNMVSTSINPEVCIAYGRREYKTVFDIYYRSLVITFVVTGLGIIFLMLFGKPIYLAWTKHAVNFDGIFFTGMLFVLLFSCLRGISSVIPLATNTHERFTGAFLISQVGGVIFSFIFLKLWPHLYVIPSVLLIAEAGLFIYSMRENNKLLDTDLKTVGKDILVQAKYLGQKGQSFVSDRLIRHHVNEN